MIWVRSASRKDLLDVQSADFEIRRVEGMNIRKLDSLSLSDELLLVWKDPPAEIRDLPVLIITENGLRMDFLAWANTYLNGLSPITSNCRVLEFDQAISLLKREEVILARPIRNALLGLVLGEAISQLYGKSRFVHLTPQACNYTFSFVVARTAFLKVPQVSVQEIAWRWSLVRELTDQPDLLLAHSDLEFVWRAFQGTFEVLSFGSLRDDAALRMIVKLLKSVSTQDDFDSVTLGELLEDAIDLPTLLNQMMEKRETRVTVLEQFMNTIARNRDLKPEVGAFLAGYLTSRIAPGTLDHHALLHRYLDLFPAAIMWYGLFAGMSSQCRLIEFSNGLGRRVLRGLMRSGSILSRPECDVELGEFDMMMAASSKGSTPNFLRTNHSRLSVELVPMVGTSIKWPQDRPDHQGSLFPDGSIGEDLTLILRRLLGHLEQTTGLGNEIKALLPKLFESPSHKSSKQSRKSNKRNRNKKGK